MNNTTLPGNTTTSTEPMQGILIFTITSYCCISITGMSANAISVTVIATNKKFHSPCFTLIAGGEVGSFLFATYFLIRAVDRLGLSLGVFPVERTGITCILSTAVVGLLANMYHVLVTISIALDRLACIFVPIRYRLWGKRYPFCVLGVCASFAVGQLVVGIFTAQLSARVVCDELAALHPLYIQSFASGNLCLCVFIVVVYSAMWVSFRFQYKFYDASKLPNGDQFMKTQASLMPTIKLMALLFLITGVLAEAMMTAAYSAPNEALALQLVSCGLVLKNASTLVESLALMIRNKTFRKACKELIGWKENKVVNIANNRQNA